MGRVFFLFHAEYAEFVEACWTYILCRFALHKILRFLHEILLHREGEPHEPNVPQGQQSPFPAGYFATFARENEHQH